MKKFNRTFDYSVFIGRFQPFHKGHLQAVHQAFQQSKHLIILVGSAFAAPNIRNPFSFEHRRELLSANLNDAGYQNKFTILPISDFYYSDNAWVAQVQQRVQTIVGTNTNIALIGSKKDTTSYYLDLFPKWQFISVEGDFTVNATDIRKALFCTLPENAAYSLKNEHITTALTSSERVSKDVSSVTLDFLNKFRQTSTYISLREEFAEMNSYKILWGNAPYPPVFVTTDAIVTCCGHVLLVTRKTHPGKGLYALPGGFLNQHEMIEDGCLRELKEETRIKVPLPVLRGSIVDKNVFDHPLRSVRGRTITHAFYIELKDKELPKVKGDDDAESAFWMPLSEVFNHPEKFFEDHAQILSSFIGRGSK